MNTASAQVPGLPAAVDQKTIKAILGLTNQQRRLLCAILAELAPDHWSPSDRSEQEFDVALHRLLRQEGGVGLWERAVARLESSSMRKRCSIRERLAERVPAAMRERLGHDALNGLDADPGGVMRRARDHLSELGDEATLQLLLWANLVLEFDREETLAYIRRNPRLCTWLGGAPSTAEEAADASALLRELHGIVDRLDATALDAASAERIVAIGSALRYLAEATATRHRLAEDLREIVNAHAATIEQAGLRQGLEQLADLWHEGRGPDGAAGRQLLEHVGKQLDTLGAALAEAAAVSAAIAEANAAGEFERVQEAAISGARARTRAQELSSAAADLLRAALDQHSSVPEAATSAAEAYDIDAAVSAEIPARTETGTTVSGPEPFEEPDGTSAVEDVDPGKPGPVKEGPQPEPALSETPQRGDTIVETAHHEFPPTDPATILFARGLQLIADGRSGLAWHLASVHNNRAGQLVAALARLAATAELEHGRLIADADLLRDDIGHVLEALEQPDHPPQWLPTIALAAIATTLEPTTFIDVVNGGAVLDRAGRSLGEIAPALSKIAAAVVAMRERYTVLTLELLARADAHGNIEERLDRFGAEARLWLEQERQRKVIYQAATTVWHEWLRPRADLGEALGIVAEDRRSEAPRVAGLVASWRDVGFVDGRIAETDRANRRQRAKHKPIEARARRTLREKASEAVHLADRWLALLDEPPPQRADHHLEQARRLVEVVSQQCARAMEELDELARAGGLPAIAAGATRVALERLERSTQSNEDVGLRISLEARLNADLLASPAVALDTSWSLVAPQGEAWVSAVKTLAETPVVHWQEVLAMRCRAGDHVSSSHLLTWLTLCQAVDDATLDQLQQDREQSVQSWRRSLARRCRQVGDIVENGFNLGLLGEDERLAMRARLEHVATQIEPSWPDASEDFVGLAGQLDEIETTLTSLRGDRIAEIKARLEASRIGELDPSALERIRGALAEEHIPVALAYIEQAERGEALPPRQILVSSPLERFWDLLEDQSVRPLRDRALKPTLLAMVGAADKRVAGEGEALIDTWLGIRDGSAHFHEQLKHLLELLGFTNIRIHDAGRTPKSRDQEAAFPFDASQIVNRDVCPVPAFGSVANGRYRVLLVRRRSSVEAILEAVVRAGGHMPTIVLFAGVLDRRDRLALRAGCHQRNTGFVVIDDALVGFLSGTPERLAALFACTLPFTWAEPYVRLFPLPSEMFFGREAEQLAIVNRTGSVAHLVFGGRQLGKTALLKQIEAKPGGGPDNVVRYVDLKAEQVGAEPARLWRVLAQLLSSARVIAGSNKTMTALRKETEAWLNASPGRSILLLLDEADAFLEADARADYRQIGVLKDLMQTTRLRFKVVFAGLHNVQRTSRDPNTPIAHLGKAIAIGPLLQGEDLEAARELVIRPLAALGYRPESVDVVTRILAHTNYYPSLIQIFCFHLLHHLQRRARLPGGRSFPVPVTMEDVEEVYSGERLAEDIGYRFRLTIQLDPRYEVIALTTADLSREDPDLLVTGIDADELREWCRSHWEAGFAKDDTKGGFLALVDELVALGVLRRVENDSYALRNANLLMLLGSDRDIRNRLEDVTRQPPPADFDPALYRLALDDQRPWRRSPLTGRQQAELFTERNGLALLWGTQVAGLEDAVAGLRAAAHRADGWQVQQIEVTADLGEVKARLQRELRVRQPDKHRMLVLDARAAWAPEWVAPLLGDLRRRSASGSAVRLVLVGGADRCWQWFLQPELHDQLVHDPLVLELFLEPWSRGTLQQMQISELDLLFSPDRWQQLDHLTGCWGPVLADLVEATTAGGRPPSDEKLRHFEERLQPAERLADVLEVREVQRLLETLRAYPDADIDSIAELGEIDLNLARRAGSWGLALCLLRGGHQALQIEPILSRALAHRTAT